jgi:hypothetical protein
VKALLDIFPNTGLDEDKFLITTRIVSFYYNYDNIYLHNNIK